MAAKKNYYAIKSGKDPLTGEVVIDEIFTSWNSAKTYVIGVESAQYAGFVTLNEAENWLSSTKQIKKTKKEVGTLKTTKPGTGKHQGNKSGITAGIARIMDIELSASTQDIPTEIQKSTAIQPLEAAHDTPKDTMKSIEIQLPETPKDILCCYVDGSFNDTIPNYSFGVICVLNGSIVYSLGGTGSNAEAVSMRQIAGELLGAMKALVYAKKNDYRYVRIYHDYIGVDKHALGTWKRTNPFSVTYYNWMQDMFRNNPEMNVSFHKVAAHSGNLYNELADVLAKKAVDMKPEPQYERVAIALGLIHPAP